jgi:hypothetical protein
MRVKRAFPSWLLSLAIMASVSHAGGPLLIFDPATRTPWAYSGAVPVYTDRGALGPLSNNTADGIVATSYAEWTAVTTAVFSAAVAGSFQSIGLPDITGSNAGLVIGPFNGGGIHVIYDDDGSVTSNFFGAPPGVLGIASPEFGSAGTLTESWVVLNGASVNPADTGGASFAGVFTHEFGHSINLAHTQTNGAVGFFGDDIGPAGCTPPYGGLPLVSDLETMYPFLDPSPGGAGVEQATVDRLDDIAALSNVYPASGWPGTFGTIEGRVFASDGTTEITGVNVIARNLAAPWSDALSALSGDFTQGNLGRDGLYTFNGLTPGADYVVYIDAIVAGGFSTTPSGVPGGAEEFYNGASEGSDPNTDDRCASVSLTAAAGSPITADIWVNEPFIVLNDDDFIEVALPFAFAFCDVVYTTVFINANGSLTFGAGDEDFSPSVSEFLAGPPRISALWTDLSPQEGSVTAAEVGGEFLVTFDDVPEFNTNNSNSFTFRLRSDGTYDVEYGVVETTAALAGRTPGGGAANPGETDLGNAIQPIAGTTVYENFLGGGDDVDLGNGTLAYAACGDPCVANTPPVASCQDVAVMGDSLQCEVSVAPSQVDNGSVDPDGGAVTLLLQPAGPYPEGVTAVVLTVTDVCGDSDTCQAIITVTCPQGPVLEVFPEDLVLSPVATADTTCGKVTIVNTGDLPLDLTSISGCDSGDFFVDTSGTSFGLAPGDTTMLDVCYVANSPEPASCDLTISSNAGAGAVSVSVGRPTDAFEPPERVEGFVRTGVWPNPFRTSTEIRFALLHESPVKLVIYDVAGRRVRALLRGDPCPAGEHRVAWDGRDERGVAVAAGTYFVRVDAGTRSWVRRAVVMR